MKRQGKCHPFSSHFLILESDFSYTSLLMFYLESIINILQRDMNWTWASSFEKTNKKNFKCFGPCPFILLMKSLFAC